MCYHVNINSTNGLQRSKQMKVFHLNILDTKEARDRLNHPVTGGWSSAPEFERYADLTFGDKAQAGVAWRKGEYTYVADVEGDDLEEAFSKTQHLATEWQANEGVTATEGSKRSTSVGDIVVKDGQLYFVASFGFEQLDISYARHSDNWAISDDQRAQIACEVNGQQRSSLDELI